MEYISNDLDGLREKIAEQTDEIVILTRLVAQTREELSDNRSMLWLKQVLPLLYRGSTRLEGALPSRIRQQQLLGKLKARKLFDAGAYLAANPDVAAVGVDPLQHYLAHGIWEGRQLGIEWVTPSTTA